MSKWYQLYIRIKYQFWKFYWKIFPPKGNKEWWGWKEIAVNRINPDAIAIGKIYPFQNPFNMHCMKVRFNSKDYGVVSIKTRKA